MVRMALIGIWLVSGANAQWGHSNMLAGAAGLSGYENILWGMAAYPASMQKNALHIGVFGEKRFLTDLLYVELACAGNVSGQPFLIRFIQNGNTSYATTGASVAFSKKLGEQVTISVSPGYVINKAKGYGSRGQPTADLGAIFRVTEKLKWGVQLYGLNSFFTDRPVNNLAVRSGFGYMVSELAFLSFEFVKEQGYPVYTMAGMQYAFHEHMNASLGYTFQLSTLSFALGFQYAGMDLSLTSMYHLSLGASTGISITRKFKQSK